MTVERFDFFISVIISFFQDICCGTGALGLCLAQVLVCFIIYSKLSNSRALGHFFSRFCFCMWQIYFTLPCVSVQLCATSKPFIYHHINIPTRLPTRMFYREEKYDVTLPWQHYFWMTTRPTTTATEGEWQKSNRFLLTKQQICTCITLFCTFLCRRCAPATWNFPRACFMESVNTTQKLSFSSSKFRYGPFGFNPRKFRQHLPN